MVHVHVLYLLVQIIIYSEFGNKYYYIHCI